MPELTRSFQEEVHAERELRLREHQAMLAAIDRLADQIRREHEVILDRVDFGFKELLNEVSDRSAGEAGGRRAGRPRASRAGRARPGRRNELPIGPCWRRHTVALKRRRR
jgi:hypothetical protein